MEFSIGGKMQTDNKTAVDTNPRPVERDFNIGGALKKQQETTN